MIDITKPANNSLLISQDIRDLAIAVKEEIDMLKASKATGSGTGLNYYLSDTASGIGTYDLMSKLPDTALEVIESCIVNNNTVLLDAYILDTEVGVTTLNGGEWSFDFYHYVSAAHATTRIIYEVYKRASGGTETLLFSVTSGDILSTVVQNYVTKAVKGNFTVLPTDKIVLKIYATTTFNNNITVYLVHSGVTHYSHVNTPLVYAHNNLEGLQGGLTTERYHVTATQATNLTSGVSGTFTTADAKTVTVTNGIITSIV